MIKKVKACEFLDKYLRKKKHEEELKNFWFGKLNNWVGFFLSRRKMFIMLMENVLENVIK